jgi:hypothetical protein
MIITIQVLFITIVLISIICVDLYITTYVKNYVVEKENNINNNSLDNIDIILDKNESILFYINRNNTILIDKRDDYDNKRYNFKQNYVEYE